MTFSSASGSVRPSGFGSMKTAVAAATGTNAGLPAGEPFDKVTLGAWSTTEWSKMASVDDATLSLPLRDPTRRVAWTEMCE